MAAEILPFRRLQEDRSGEHRTARLLLRAADQGLEPADGWLLLAALFHLAAADEEVSMLELIGMVNREMPRTRAAYEALFGD